MERRDRLLLALGLLAAAGAAAAAVLLPHGTVDATGDPPVRPPVAAPAGPRPGIPPLVLPPGFPAEAGRALRAAYETIATGTEEEAARALGALAVPDPAGPILPAAAPVLRAMAPALGWLIADGPEPGLAVHAMRAAAGLTRAGGGEGRRAIEESGLVRSAFALQAVTGRPALRVQAALLLGYVATGPAVDWLVNLLERAAEPEVREAAVAGLVGAYRVNGTLPNEAIAAIKKAQEAPGAPPEVRRACLDAYREAFADVQRWNVLPGALAAYDDPDPAVRMAVVRLLADHVVTAGGPVLVRAAEDADPRIVQAAAEALPAYRPSPEGALPALERVRPRLTDEGAQRAVDAALRALRPGR